MLNKIIISGLLISGITAQGYALYDCVQIALEGKKTVLSAELGVSSAEKGLTGSYSGLLPSLQASTGASRQQYSDTTTIFNNNYNRLSAGISLNQTIYDGGRSLNQVRQAKLNLNIAKQMILILFVGDHLLTQLLCVIN